MSNVHNIIWNTPVRCVRPVKCSAQQYCWLSCTMCLLNYSKRILKQNMNIIRLTGSEVIKSLFYGLTLTLHLSHITQAVAFQETFETNQQNKLWRYLRLDCFTFIFFPCRVILAIVVVQLRFICQTHPAIARKK